MSELYLTHEQAKIIEKIKREGSEDSAINYYAKVVSGELESNDILRQLTIPQLARALYGEYKVEPEYKEGNWVVYEDSKGICKIAKITKVIRTLGFGDVEFIDQPQVYFDDDWVCRIDRVVRLATDKEVRLEQQRRIFSKHGRELWKMRKGDVIIRKGASHPTVVMRVTDAGIRLRSNRLITVQELKEDYNVVCFVENRLDN